MMKINLKKIKAKSDQRLIEMDYEGFDFLPELDVDFHFKTLNEIKQRALALATIVQYSFDLLSKEKILENLNVYSNTLILTNDEKNLLESNLIEDKNNFTWRIEAVWVLLWGLSIVEDINPYELAEVNSIEKDKYPSVNADPAVFFNEPSIIMRSENEIIEMLDLYSRLDYICDWFKINGLNSDLDSAAIYERRYALIWLTQNKDEWDEILCNSII